MDPKLKTYLNQGLWAADARRIEADEAVRDAEERLAAAKDAQQEAVSVVRAFRDVLGEHIEEEPRTALAQPSRAPSYAPGGNPPPWAK